MKETQETWVWPLGREDPLEKEMPIHSSILAWSIPQTEEPGGLQSTEWWRVRHDWARARAHTHTHPHTYLYIKFPLCKFWSRIFVPLLGSLSLQLQRNAFFFTPEKVQRVMHLCDAHSTLIKAQFRQQIIIPKYWEISHLQMRQKSDKDLT